MPDLSLYSREDLSLANYELKHLAMKQPMCDITRLILLQLAHEAHKEIERQADTPRDAA